MLTAVLGVIQTLVSGVSLQYFLSPLAHACLPGAQRSLPGLLFKAGQPRGLPQGLGQVTSLLPFLRWMWFNPRGEQRSQKYFNACSRSCYSDISSSFLLQSVFVCDFLQTFGCGVRHVLNHFICLLHFREESNIVSSQYQLKKVGFVVGSICWYQFDKRKWIPSERCRSSTL